MIKLDNGGLIDLDKEAKDHLDRLTNQKNNFLSPKISLENWLNDPASPPIDAPLIQSIVDNFEMIVKANPTEIRDFIDQFGDVADETFSNEIVKHLRYENFRDSSRARILIRNLHLKACPYCNSQYILQLGVSGKLLCHFDHIYPKRQYPYLCISYFNLIPCCSHCNQFKSNSDPKNNLSFIHPYEDSLADKFKFRATTKALGAFHIGGRTKHDEQNLELVLNDGVVIDFHESTFKLVDIHNEHNDIIDEVYLKSQIYNSSYYEELKKKYVEEQNLMTEDELQRVIYGNFIDNSKINKRPLAKMTQDLLKQFQELKRDSI